MRRILVIGAGGQVGTALSTALSREPHVEHVLRSDIHLPSDDLGQDFVQLDAMDESQVRTVIEQENITEVYLMAAMLSATAEKHPLKAWNLNMQSLLIILEAAKDGLIKKVFWPSSIAVFGPSSQKVDTPQKDILEPGTVYGISKSSGELWCAYYHQRYGVDVRSIRYPGLIGSDSLPGGGTTDYAVHIFHEALDKGSYTCFLSPQRRLPMMHMDDAIRATLEIMRAPKDDIRIRTSYNISAMDFSPEELSAALKEELPHFEMQYDIDERDDIARSWPERIDDTEARKDWGWKARVNLKDLVKNMLQHLRSHHLV